MKKGLVFVFLVLALIHYGVSAPRKTDTSDTAGNLRESENNTASVSPQGFSANQIFKFFGRKTSKDLMSEKKSKNQNEGSTSSQGKESTAGAFKLPSNPVVLGVPSFTKVPAIAVRPKVFQTPSKFVVSNVSSSVKIQKISVLASPSMAPSVVAIRPEIRKFGGLNKPTSPMNTKQDAQTGNAQGNAIIHDEILDEQEGAQKQAFGRKMIDENDFSAQEKSRNVYEEATRNAPMTDEFNEIPATSGLEPAEKS